MALKLPLSQLGINSAIDYCALSPGDPPLNFKNDLHLSNPATDLPVTYRNPTLDKTTYWGPSP